MLESRLTSDVDMTFGLVVPILQRRSVPLKIQVKPLDVRQKAIDKSPDRTYKQVGSHRELDPFFIRTQ